MIAQSELVVRTRGRGAYELTSDVQSAVASSGVQTGTCQVFVMHTSASLIISENADPDVMHDLESFMSRQVPDGDPMFTHTAEGPDDMPAHVRSILTQASLDLPVTAARCHLGTWQGIFLWEHRHSPHTRRLVLTINGD